MDIGIGRVRLLYAVGILFGVIATFYFAFRLLEDLSPTITAILLFLAFLLFAAAGLAVGRPLLDTVFYAIAAAAYFIGVAYTITTFDLGDTSIFLLLAGSSGLFIAMGYLSYEGVFDLDRRRATIAMGVLLLLGVALVGVDVAGPQPTTEADFAEELEVPGSPTEVGIGTVTVHNPFVLSRTADPPRYYGCLYAPELRIAPIGYVDGSGELLLPGGNSETYELVVRPHVFFDGDELRGSFQAGDSIPVEVGSDCPPADGSVRFVVVSDRPEPPIQRS